MQPLISAEDHQSLTAECLKLEKLIKSLPQNDSVPQTIYNQLITQAQSMKEKLGQLNVRHVELECQNNEFKNSNQRSDENVNLNSKPPKNNNDKIKVELLSHECQTTDETILADQLSQDQVIFCFDIFYKRAYIIYEYFNKQHNIGKEHFSCYCLIFFMI